MTTVYIAPGQFGAGAQFFTVGGLPLNAGLIYTYAAGTTTPQATYTTSAGSVQNANPVVLGADGRPPNEIWLVAGVSYRFDLKDSLGNLIKTYDNLTGINDLTTAQLEWSLGPTPTFLSATSFSLVGDQTGSFQVGRRLKTTNTSGTIYSTITVSAFAAVTTVTVVNDSSTLDSGLSAVSYGLISATNTSEPLIIDTFPVRSGSADKTKKVRLEVDGLTTATTRVVTVPDRDITLGDLSPITNSLSGDVVLNDITLYFTGPSVAQGTAGTWFASGTVSLVDSVGSANYDCKLWDGTTVIASCRANAQGAATPTTATLSGFITSPAGNIRISVKDATNPNGLIKFNFTGNSKDSTITAMRIG